MTARTATATATATAHDAATTRIPVWRVVAGLTLPWLLWLAVLTAGLPSTPGTSPLTRYLETAMVFIWISPVITVPVTLWTIRRARHTARPWFAAHRWGFAGLLTAVAMTCAALAAAVAGLASLVVEGDRSLDSALEPMAGLVLISIVTALPLWFMAAGLAIGPGTGPAPRRAVAAS